MERARHLKIVSGPLLSHMKYSPWLPVNFRHPGNAEHYPGSHYALAEV